MEGVIKKIAAGAEDFGNLKEYARSLIKRFDRNNDGIISFRELCLGLKSINIFLTAREREGLMKKLDTNQDGNISEHELYKAFSTINVEQLR
jgi:Ca2+-binding EF-hand superfamily protein